MIEDLTPVEVAERLSSDSPPLLLDVREDWERELAAITGSMHIPMAELPSRLDEVPSDRQIVVACHHGSRSLQVAVWLDAQGYDEVANLEGGIEAWSEQVDHSIPSY